MYYFNIIKLSFLGENIIMSFIIFLIIIELSYLMILYLIIGLLAYVVLDIFGGKFNELLT